MAETNSPNDVRLPESLIRQFTSLERRLWKVETAGAVCFSAIALMVSFLVLFFSDRIWETAVWFRVFIFAIGVAVVVFAIMRWLRLWVFQRRDWRALSIIVQRRFSRLGDRLLGIVELASQKERPENFSPELCRAAIHQVAEEAEKINFRKAIETARTKKSMIAALVLFMFLLLPAILAPSATWNAFQRWSAPFATIERYTLVQIAGLPEKLIVPHGESFEVRASVNYRSFWQPARAIARLAKNWQVDSKVRNNEAIFQLPGQIQNGHLKIKIGDASASLAIEPAYRPGLKELSVKVELPDYLKYPPVEEKVQAGSLRVLESSHVSFRGKISRALKNAMLSDGTNVHQLDIRDDEFSSLPLVSDGVSHFSFAWQDALGLSNAVPWRLAIHAEKDRPPAPDLPELPRDMAILVSDVLQIKAKARDDFGVRDLGLSWEFGSSAEEPLEWGSTELKVNKSSAHEKNVEDVFTWSPSVFRIPPDTSVEMIAFATDFFPGRERTESARHVIHILSNEKHAELVRQNLESVLARVEEVARLEEKVLAKTEELAADEKLKADEAAAKIGKTADEQQQGAKNLEQLAREGMNTLREALKNPIFTEQALQQWAKTLKEMQDLSQGKMKEAASDLKSAQQDAGDPAAKEKNLSSAQSKLEEILKELEQLQAKVNKGLDDLQALTLSERLRKLGEVEQEIGGHLQKIIPETIGMLSKELPEKYKKLEANLSSGQEQVHSEAQLLQKEIHRFFERTQKPNYGEVSTEMTEARTGEELDHIRALVAENVSMEATRNLARWSEHFLEWADKLKPPADESSPSGEGQGENAMNMTQTLVALLRLRLGEINLHSQTRLLEEQKQKLPGYAERASELFATQQKITEGLEQLEKENKAEALAVPYAETREAMAGVEALLQKPQTDEVASVAEMKTIESLTDIINLINEQAKRNPPPQSGGEQQQPSEEMSFLMQMAQQPGAGKPMAMPGGNTSGGSTSQGAEPTTGDSTGKASDARQVNKASAASINWPVEFRETLENYFKALEKEQ